MEFARDFSLDTDELNLLIHDKARAQKVVKALAGEERKREKEREAAEQREPKKTPVPENVAETAEDTAASPPAPQREPGSGKQGQALPAEGESGKDKQPQKTLFDGF